MQDHRIRVRDIELQVREYEHPGDAIIWLHFSGANMMMWQGVVPWFQDSYRLILVDLRGHGRSDSPQAGYHIDDMAGDVAGVMDRLGIERAHIVGSSLGAEVGLSLAANHPGKVVSLVNDGALYSEYGPYGVWEGTQAEFKAHVARTLQERREAPEPVYPSVDALVGQSRLTFEKLGWWNEHVETMKRYGAREIEGGLISSSWRKHANLDYMAHYYRCRFEDYYRRVTCPVLMLPDDDWDDERLRAVIVKMGQLAGAEIVVLPGWVHPYGWMLSPGGISEVVLGFLGRVGG